MLPQSEKKLLCMGMVHIPPLPGSPLFDENGGLQKIFERCANDFKVYLDSGIDGVIFENFGDVPFYPDKVPPETIASMTWVITHCLQKFIGEKSQVPNSLMELMDTLPERCD